MNTMEFLRWHWWPSNRARTGGISAFVEIEPDYVAALRLNRLNCRLRCTDMNSLDGQPFEGIVMFEPARVSAE